MRSVSNVNEWNFPAPPHVAHVKVIAIDPHNPNCIYSCVEQGELLRSGLRATGAARQVRNRLMYKGADGGRRPQTEDRASLGALESPSRSVVHGASRQRHW
jgi:hypothetical protein